MKQTFYNPENIDEKEISKKEIRTKLIIINDQDEILLGYAHKTYQFPGGHLIEGETLKECLIREVKEETGIDLDFDSVKHFYKITRYTKDYPNKKDNTEFTIDYYYLKSNVDYNLEEVNYDEMEKAGNYKLVYIPMKNLINTLKNSIPDNPVNEVIVSEMIEVIEFLERNVLIKN